MANNNPHGSAKYWFDGSVAACIDNGVDDAVAAATTNNWIGTTNYWYQGTPTGYLQGGPGGPGESPPNFIMYGYRGAAGKGRAYAMIIY